MRLSHRLALLAALIGSVHASFASADTSLTTEPIHSWKYSAYAGVNAGTQTSDITGTYLGNASPLLGGEARYILHENYGVGLIAEGTYYAYRSDRSRDLIGRLMAVGRYQLANVWLELAYGLNATSFGTTFFGTGIVGSNIDGSSWGVAISPRVGLDLPGGFGMQVAFTSANFSVGTATWDNSGATPFATRATDSITRDAWTFSVRANF